MRFLVTRPDPECKKTAEKLRVLGHDADEAPVLGFVSLVPDVIPVEGVSAIALTSRRAISALAMHSQFHEIHSLPVFAVGDMTADTARAAGFGNVFSADGDVDALRQLVLEKRALIGSGAILYPAAQDRSRDLVSLLELEGLRVTTLPVYRMEPVAGLPADVLQKLRSAAYDGVLVYSRRSAETFGDLLKKSGLDHILSDLPVYAISSQTAEPLLDSGNVFVSEFPNENALLKLVLAEC